MSKHKLSEADKLGVLKGLALNARNHRKTLEPYELEEHQLDCIEWAVKRLEDIVVASFGDPFEEPSDSGTYNLGYHKPPDEPMVMSEKAAALERIGWEHVQQQARDYAGRLQAVLIDCDDMPAQFRNELRGVRFGALQLAEWAVKTLERIPK